LRTGDGAFGSPATATPRVDHHMCTPKYAVMNFTAT